MIESFNGQLSTRINKATYVSDSSNWVELLPQIMESYNSLHPIDAKNVIEPAKLKPDKVKIGDYVRTRNIRENVGPKLGLRGTSSYSDQVYRVISKNGNRYVLTNIDMTKIIKEALDRNMQVVNKPVNISTITLPQIKKAATKAKKFIKLQCNSNLDVNNSGLIVPPIIPTLAKRSIRKPSYLNNYV
jgi:hypothetical protein